VETAPAALRSKTVKAYTDLKFHELGFERPVRTTPLWGLNSFGPPYMHDGSAISIEEAISTHRGEALHSADMFGKATAVQQGELIEYLKGL
jgi:CxxC motif-containing protein (DUF1111 family)